MTSCTAILSMFAVGATPAFERATELERGFRNPPDSAKPRVWWHWMDGNITKEGIKLDLEWMKRVGIGGFQNFDAGLFVKQFVDKRLVYMTPEWKDAFRYAITLADELGLEAAIAGSPGWSETGGPWVKAPQAMKKYVWSETHLEGGQRFTGVLPQPPRCSGPFQNIPRSAWDDSLSAKTLPPMPEHCGEIAVVAYRVPDCQVAMNQLQPKVTSSGANIDAAALSDGDFATATLLPAAPIGEKAWVLFEYAQPRSVRALTLAATVGIRLTPSPGNDPELEVSDDGQTFRKVVTIPGGVHVLHTVSFPEVTARFFRVTFPSTPRMPMLRLFAVGGIPEPAPLAELIINELVLHSDVRVHLFEEKAGFSTWPDLYSHPTPTLASSDAIAGDDVVDLTSKMEADGTLDWTPPPGHWVVLRMGYSLTGATNSPASPEATGLEVDKLNRVFVKEYLDQYLDMFSNATGGLMGTRGLTCLITDSYEAGPQNWTDNMPAEFRKRRGYDLRPWLPVLAGRVVSSAEASDKFLWDFRQTIGELYAEEHYDQVARSVKERGMSYYSESHEGGRAFVGDGIAAKRNADVPMGAIWTKVPGGNYMEPNAVYDSDIRESASVAHLYGRNMVAAESFTTAFGPYGWSPASLKPTADRAMAMGLNRFVIHTSVHQPLVGQAPGIGLGPVGQWFTRNETWAEQAKPWLDYLARSSYLLQQGQFVADVLYYYGEDSNITALFSQSGPPVPRGYNYDYVNADALMNKLSVEDGRIVTESGMSYRVLVLDPRSRYTSLPVLRKIRDLVAAGAVVVGTKPMASPSLADDEAEFARIADELWVTNGRPARGKGRVIEGMSVEEALASLRIVQDVEIQDPKPDTNLFFLHRNLGDADLYFVNNRTDREERIAAIFRVEGKEAELWHADSGEIEPASFSIQNGRTTVPLILEPWGSVFVVFRGQARGACRTLPECAERLLATIDGPWEVTFPHDLGAPRNVTMERLGSWCDSQDAGMKYFSGTATYTKTIDLSADWLQPDAQIWLNLGDVRELAEVAVNDRPLGIAWKPPFRLNASEVLKPGSNRLAVRVTNLWVNRLIGDAQPDAKQQYTISHLQFYKADDPLVPSGLLGPVTIVAVTSNAQNVQAGSEE